MALDSKQCSGRRLQTVNFLIDQVSVLFRASSGDAVLHREISSLDDDDVLEGVSHLINCGCQPATPNASGFTPLHIAVERGLTTVVTHLLSLDVPLPPDILFTAVWSASTFEWARRRTKLEIIRVEALVTSGCDTRIRNVSGHTPCMLPSSWETLLWLITCFPWWISDRPETYFQR